MQSLEPNIYNLRNRITELYIHYYVVCFVKRKKYKNRKMNINNPKNYCILEGVYYLGAKLNDYVLCNKLSNERLHTLRITRLEFCAEVVQKYVKGSISIIMCGN